VSALDSLFDDAPAPSGLRPYQTDAIARVDEAIDHGVRRIMLQLATGSGKTLIASAMVRDRDRPTINDLHGAGDRAGRSDPGEVRPRRHSRRWP